MSNIVFKTNPVHHVVNGKEQYTSLLIPINRTEFDTLETLKSRLTNELQAKGVQVHINSSSLLVNTHPVVDIRQITQAPAGADLKVNLTQLTTTEVNSLKSMKITRDQLNEKKALLANKVTLRESLQKKLSVLENDITQLTDETKKLFDDLLSQAKKLPRLIPQSGRASVHAAQKNTLFSASVPASASEPVAVPASVDLPKSERSKVQMMARA